MSIRVEDECRIPRVRVTRPKARGTIVNAARLHSGCMKGVHGGTRGRLEGNVESPSSGLTVPNPKYRIGEGTEPDAPASRVIRERDHRREAEWR
jgi:hypothetical protein